jgi:hypothetical protein
MMASFMFGLLEDGDGVSTAPQNHMTIILTLLALLGVVLVTGVVLTCLIGRYLRSRKAAALAGPRVRNRPEFDGDRGVHSSIFDSPGRWLAIKSSSQQAVQRALGLHNATPCSWTEGIARLNNHKLFISSSINSWILVMGTHLPESSEDVDAVFQFLLRLSRELGEVQYFSVNRVLGHHAWARLDHGRVVRGYAWAGETLWNQGPKTWAERKLGLKCYDYFSVESRNYLGQAEQAWANAEKVMLLSAIWSVDPTSIDDSVLTSAAGVAGDFSPARLH